MTVRTLLSPWLPSRSAAALLLAPLLPAALLPAALLPAALLFAGAAPAVAAPPKVEFFFPTGAARGTTVTLTAAGTFPDWPVEVHAEHPGLRVTAGKKKGELQVEVEPEAACGIAWLRLHTPQGASQPAPLVIGALPETSEQEPNNAREEAQEVELPQVVSGKLAERGDVDTFAVQLAAGQRMVAAVDAHRTFGSPMDAVLQIVDPQGFLLAQNDDTQGLDPLLEFEAPTAGRYLIRLFAFPATPNSSIAFASGTNFVYRLTLSGGGVVEHAMPLALRRGGSAEVFLAGWNLPELPGMHCEAVDPLREQLELATPLAAGSARLAVVEHPVLLEEPRGEPAAPQAVPVPAVVCGRLAAPGETDAYRFSAGKGEKISLRVEAYGLGLPLDPVLQLFDAEGKQLASVDDLSRERDPAHTFTAPAEGEYEVRLRDLHRRGGERFAYRLTLEPPTPRFTLTLAAGEFTAAAGKPLEIPVTVARDAGLRGEIEIAVEGLPEGVTAEPVVSEEKGDSAKQVKLRLQGSSAAHGPIRIVGRLLAPPAEAAPLAPRAAHFPLPTGDRRHAQAWFTLTP